MFQRVSLRLCTPKRGAVWSISARSFGKATSNKEGQVGVVAFQMDEVTKKFDHTGRTLFRDVSLSFYDGAKIGILGSNGAGKSSLLRIMAGVEKDFDGISTPMNNRVVGYLHQEPQLDEDKTVLECVLEGVAEDKAVLDRYEAVSLEFGDSDITDDKMNELIEEQGGLQTIIDDRNLWDLDMRINIAMDALRCPVPERSIVGLSGGEKRRVALCRLLLSEPDILLLDEPTNHLDASSVGWLENFLSEYKGLVVAITHDRYFLDNVAGYILEITNGQCIPFKGNYNGWLQMKASRAESEDKQGKAQDKVMARELAWLRGNVRGGRSRDKSRVKKAQSMVAANDEKRLSMRIESGALVIPEGTRLMSPTSLRVRDLCAKVNDRTLFENINFDLGPGDIVGIVGPNGVGKTTLLRMIVGEIPPTSGEVQVNSRVSFAYNSQMRGELRADNPVWFEIVDHAETVTVRAGTSIQARRYVAQFNFSGKEQDKKIGQLSGGERNRVHLAKSLIKGANAILLDEPTNDLDVDTLRKLEEALIDFKEIGFVAIVSHDRWFLDRVCTNILAIERDGPVWFEGNYSDYERERGSPIGDGSGTRKKLMSS